MTLLRNIGFPDHTPKKSSPGEIYSCEPTSFIKRRPQINSLAPSVLSPFPAFIIAIDCSAKGLEGNVTQQFIRRWGDEWEEIADEFDFPISLERSAYVKSVPPVPFRYIFVASILDHLNKVERAKMPAVLRSSLHEALSMSQSLKLGTLACPLLKGGWRMHASIAFHSTVEVVDEFINYPATLERHWRCTHLCRSIMII